jgi:type I restriction enzyme S subunit
VAKDQLKKLTPKLRFLEFVGQSLWTLQLKDVTTESTVRNGETLTVGAVMGVTKTEGIVPMEERLIASDIARYKLVRKDWFAYNPMRLNIGSIARWTGASDVLVSPDYVVFKCLEDTDPGINPAYLDQLRQTAAWENFVTEGGDGSVRVRIYYPDLARLHLALPSSAEQGKIASCLMSLDELLAAEGRRLEALRAHKNGLMQQLFPRPGECRPRLRFREFRDAQEWEGHTLGDIVSISKGKGVAKADIARNGKTPCIRYAELYTTYGEIIRTVHSRTNVPVDELVLSEAGDVIIPGSGETKEDIATCACVLEAGVALGGDLNVLRSGIDGQFFSYYLNGCKRAELAKVAQGDTVAHLYPSQISRLMINFPSDLAEQQRIAACLASLDALIAAALRKLDGLRAHKKGLMQQLFPSPEGV